MWHQWMIFGLILLAVWYVCRRIYQNPRIWPFHPSIQEGEKYYVRHVDSLGLFITNSAKFAILHNENGSSGPFMVILRPEDEPYVKKDSLIHPIYLDDKRGKPKLVLRPVYSSAKATVC